MQPCERIITWSLPLKNIYNVYEEKLHISKIVIYQQEGSAKQGTLNVTNARKTNQNWVLH